MADMQVDVAQCSQATALLTVVDAHRADTVAQQAVALTLHQLADVAEAAVTVLRAAAVAATLHQQAVHLAVAVGTLAAAAAVVDTQEAAVAAAAAVSRVAAMVAVVVTAVAAEAAMVVAEVTADVDNVAPERTFKI